MELLLGSKSPRRRSLLKKLNFDFKVVSIDCDEDYPEMDVEDVAEFLSYKKSSAYEHLEPGQLLVTADTTVVVDEMILEKPVDRDDAIRMLNILSNRSHDVITGVCLRTTKKRISFSEKTTVLFNSLSDDDITYYVDTYKPYDKAGGYGIQEWIGDKRVEKIIGSFNNVVGLPIAKLSEVLKTEFNLPSS